MLVPVGKLDDDLDLRVHGPGRLDEEVFRDLVHQIEAELGPCAVSLCRDVGGGLGGDEEEVVEDDFVKMAGGELGHPLDEGAVVGVRVAERAELAGVVVGVGDAAGDAHALIREELLQVLQGLLVGQHAVPLGLDVDLVDLELAADGLPFALPDRGIGEPADDHDRDVDGGLEILVMAGRGSGGGKQETGKQSQEEQAGGAGVGSHGDSTGVGLWGGVVTLFPRRARPVPHFPP